ncbi:MAG: hypothetical protein MHMPM18_003501, partial [Marteilia pararefringens]
EPDFKTKILGEIFKLNATIDNKEVNIDEDVRDSDKPRAEDSKKEIIDNLKLTLEEVNSLLDLIRLSKNTNVLNLQKAFEVDGIEEDDIEAAFDAQNFKSFPSTFTSVIY